MSGPTDSKVLTGSLQDYLETIYETIRERKVARVRDIAQARGVRAASVTPAMRRLADLDLIRYLRREYIELTPKGEVEARRVLARHHLLTRFLREVLGMSAADADRDACAMEHNLSDSGVDHLVRFFEYLQVCPGGREFLDRFHGCPVAAGTGGCDATACGTGAENVARAARNEEARMSLSDLKPGDRGRVAHVSGSGAVRQRLLDLGLLPDATFQVERVAPAGDPIWIRLEGFELSLRRTEARTVLVERN